MRVAVVGATGAVGSVMRRLLRERSFPADEVVFFASERSAGKELDGQTIQPLSDETIGGFDLALFSAGGGTSREWSPRFAAWIFTLSACITLFRFCKKLWPRVAKPWLLVHS